jgi:glycosyltransferase involved in cell wall biosynthesis
MHVLFVHKNFPAQFGHIASYLIKDHGFRCSFVSELPSGVVDGIERVQYKIQGGATKNTHYCSRTFENATWHSHAVYEAMKARPDIKPDLIVGHSGFGSTLFLADLYDDTPMINYFEYYYRSKGSDLDFRPDFPVKAIDVLRSRTRNAMILCDLQTSTRGYTPTGFQRSLFPDEYLPKVEPIFDGIDTNIWYRKKDVPREIAGHKIPADKKIVTYVSRGFESMRGFDIFMKVAKKICDARDDVIFLCVGSDRVCYGGDLNRIKEKTYRAHILAQDNYDLERFIFTGRVEPSELVDVFSLSDLHIYLTVPFVLSWSLMNSLACGCTVLGSATAPVQEMITHGENGLLADFFDIDAQTELALQVLDDPEKHRFMGEAGARMIQEKYALDKCLPQMLDLYERTCNEKVAS